jgi:hypothetical protein
VRGNGFITVVIVLTALLLVLQVAVRTWAKLRPGPAPAFVGPLLNSPVRRMGQCPRKIVLRSRIEPGMEVVDLGCGSGVLTP